MGIGVTVITCGLMTVFARPIFGLFNKEEAVIAYGIQAARYSFPFYWIYVIHEVLACTIRGTGKSLPPMLIILMNLCVIRSILLFWIMSFFHDIRGVAIVYPITWVLTSTVMVLYYRFGTGRLKGFSKNKVGKNDEECMSVAEQLTEKIVL